MRDLFVSAVAPAAHATLASAIVLRCKAELTPQRFVTHMRIWNDSGTMSHSSGGYYDNLSDALADYGDRCKRLKVEPFPNPVEPVEFDPRKFAETCIERMAALGFKGKKRDDACLDYYIGAAVALEQAGAKEAAGIIRTQAVLIVSIRGFIGVGGIAHRLPA